MSTFFTVMFVTFVIELFLAGVHHAAVARKRAGLADTCTITIPPRRVSRLVK